MIKRVRAPFLFMFFLCNYKYLLTLKNKMPNIKLFLYGNNILLE